MLFTKINPKKIVPRDVYDGALREFNQLVTSIDSSKNGIAKFPSGVQGTTQHCPVANAWFQIFSDEMGTPNVTPHGIRLAGNVEFNRILFQKNSYLSQFISTFDAYKLSFIERVLSWLLFRKIYL